MNCHWSGNFKNYVVDFIRIHDYHANPNDYDIKYPITIVDAIHDGEDPSSITLREILNKINSKLSLKQPIVEAGYNSQILTRTPTRGVLGSLMRVSEIVPSNIRSSSHIPDEIAVGNYVDRLVNKINVDVAELQSKVSELKTRSCEDKAQINSLKEEINWIKSKLEIGDTTFIFGGN